MKHRWSSASRPNERETVRHCIQCGLVKVSRHEGGFHWNEYRNSEDRLLEGARMPPCPDEEFYSQLFCPSPAP